MNVIYANDLWIMAASYEKAALNTSDQQQAELMRKQSIELRKDALSDALYTVALLEVDGARCFWGPARQGQLHGIVPQWKPIWQFGAQLSPQEREGAVTNAMKLERLTAPLRQSDRWLCMTGWRDRPDIVGTGLGLEGAKPVANKPSEIGRTYAVQVDPSKLRLFLDEKDWAIREQTKRMALARELALLVEPNALGDPAPGR